jgi:hypothetical protein
MDAALPAEARSPFTGRFLTFRALAETPGPRLGLTSMAYGCLAITPLTAVLVPGLRKRG